ncbi:MAG: Unknown protein [uncultured Sulfurovum sp.]|uniref:Uncharacterized protein n=1 Tax=uncultured Sulfurovum sp. TaxID=269237 RepID=A0A6S6T6P0_9BACT|nr:MAG: Unknown protein [uncultured Sulfurovum sp.]
MTEWLSIINKRSERVQNDFIDGYFKPLLELTNEYTIESIFITIFAIAILRETLKGNKLVTGVALVIGALLVAPIIIKGFKGDDENSSKIIPKNNIERPLPLEKAEKPIIVISQSLEDLNTEKAISMEDAIYQYLGYQNNAEYDKSFKFAKKLKEDLSIESYKEFWKKHDEQFILYKIDNNKKTFQVIIDYEKGFIDVLMEYTIKQHSDNSWYLTHSKKVSDLRNFDNWKIVGDEKLHAIFQTKTLNEGSLYELKPSSYSIFIKFITEDTYVKAYVDTKEGRFYLSKWSLEQLVENKTYNWIYEDDF